MNCAGVYFITAASTQRVYIGSSQSVAHRWGHHKSRLRSGKHCNTEFQAHVDRFGVDDLTCELVEPEADGPTRLALEQMLIGALFGPLCFNQAKDVRAPFQGRRHSCSTIVKMKSRKLSPEHRARIAASMIGNRNRSTSSASHGKVY